jgi:hypothetical protein
MSLLKKTKSVLDGAQKLYKDLVELNVGINAAAKSHNLTESEGTDIGFLLREVERISDEVRKEAASRKDMLGTLLAAKIVQDYQQNPKREFLSRGTLATGIPDVKPIPYLPATGTSDWEELCRFLGFSEEAITRKFAKLHWPHLQEYAKELAAEGKELPYVTTKTQAVMTFRKRSNG